VTQPRRLLLPAMLGVLLLLVMACSGNDDEPQASSSESATSELGLTVEDQVAQLIETGITQAQGGDNASAAVTFNNALVLDPGNKFAYFNLGLMDQSSGKADKATQSYDLALETDPAYTPALYNKAILMEPTDLAGAVAIYEKILEIDPEASTTYLRLSFAYRTLGDDAKADAAREKAVALDPSLADITELPK